MFDYPISFRCGFGTLRVLALSLIAAIAISGCGSTSGTVSAKPTATPTSAPIPPAIYTLAQGALTGPAGPPPSSLNAYDSVSGTQRFSHMFSSPNDPSGLVATQNR